MNHESSRIQQQGWQIKIQEKNGCNVGKPQKSARKNSIESKIKIGQKFNCLTAIEKVGRDKRQNLTWLFQCDCGNFRTATVSNVISGNTQSCGCIGSIGKIKHGLSLTPEHKAWTSIKERCFCPTNVNYKYYGLRGITMFEPWRDSFELFLSYVGKKPTPIHSIDRINVNGNYEPGNVRWSTSKEQCNNRRSNKLILFNGITLTLSQWSDKLGYPKSVIGSRIRNGWDIETALTKPPKTNKQYGNAHHR